MRFRLDRLRDTSSTDRGPLVEVVFDDGGMNLLSLAALDELDEVLDQPVATGAAALLFRSGRDSIFAAGADMREMRRFTGQDALEFAARGQALFRRIEALAVPAAVLVDGDCFGGAFDLALAFGVRIATRRSRFAHPGARIGIVTGFGGTSRWRGAVSPPYARTMFLSNRVTTAEQMLDAGFLSAVVESRDAGVKWVASRAGRLESPEVRVARALVARAAGMSVEQRLLMARRLQHLYSAASAETRPPERGSAV